MSRQDTIKLAVLDDYQSVALEAADWSLIEPAVDISVFETHLGDADAVVRCLLYTSPSPRDGLLSRMPSSA